MEVDLNLELRSDIIEIALHVENFINQLLTSYLNIENENLKALGNKNSSLSFKNKIDLLSDIDVFSKEEHFKFLLLMEFRNQFMHNFACNSFQKAIDILGTDRGKQLLKYDKVNSNIEIEIRYKEAFYNLFLECVDVIIGKYEDKRKSIEMKRMTMTNISDYSNYLMDRDSEVIHEIMKKCVPDFHSDTIELSRFKSELFDTIATFINSTSNDQQFLSLRQKIEAIDKTKLKSIFK